MIEATIRDENNLLYILIIRPATCMHDQPIRDALEVDVFIPAKGEHLSATMPAGGDPPAQIARAFMTVFPPAHLTPQEQANQEYNEMLDKHASINPDIGLRNDGK